jgi:hypothetical protein
MKTPSEKIPLIYRIDGTNRICWVNDAWREFAQANQGEAVLPERILGHDLLASLADTTARELYTTMIRQVRTGKTVRFDYRCDAPDKRRTFTMEIRPVPDEGVEFVTTLQREQPRPTIALLKPETPRDPARFIRMCSWCHSVAMPDGRWLEVETAVAELRLLEGDRLPAITHTMCAPCYQRVMAILGTG